MACRLPASRRWALASLRTFAATSAPTKKKTIQQLAKEISLKNVPVLVRADLNLPRSKEDGSIVDDTRARAVRDEYIYILCYVPNVLCAFRSCRDTSSAPVQRDVLAFPSTRHLIRAQLLRLSSSIRFSPVLVLELVTLSSCTLFIVHVVNLCAHALQVIPTVKFLLKEGAKVRGEGL